MHKARRSPPTQAGWRPLRGPGPRWDSRPSHTAGPGGSARSAAKAIRALLSEPGELRREGRSPGLLTPSPSLPPTVALPTALPPPGAKGPGHYPTRRCSVGRRLARTATRAGVLAAGLRKPTGSLAEAFQPAEPRRLMGDRNSLPKLCGTQRAPRFPQASSARLSPGLGRAPLSASHRRPSGPSFARPSF